MMMHIHKESSIEIASAQYLAFNMKSGLERLAVQLSKLPRLEIDDSHILNHVRQARNELQVRRVLLEIVLPIFLALEF